MDSFTGHFALLALILVEALWMVVIWLPWAWGAIKSRRETRQRIYRIETLPEQSVKNDRQPR